jgi:hypothetical protein
MKGNIVNINLRLIWLVTGMAVTLFGIYIFLSVPKKYVEAGALHKPIWAGYTSASTANLGGTKGADTTCNSAYSGSHWASGEELVALGSSYPWTYDVWLGHVFAGPMILSRTYVIGAFKAAGSEYIPYLNPVTCTGWTSGSQTISLADVISGYNGSGFYRGDYYLNSFYGINYQYGSVMRAAGYPDWNVCSASYRLACVQ